MIMDYVNVGRSYKGEKIGGLVMMGLMGLSVWGLLFIGSII